MKWAAKQTDEIGERDLEREADKDEDLGQGQRLNALRKLSIVKIKLQEPVNLR